MKPQRPGPRLGHQGRGRTPEVLGLPSRPCSPCGGRGGGGRSPLWLPEASSRLAGDLQRPSAGCGAAGPGPRTGCLMCPTAAGLGKLTAGLRAQSLLSMLSCTQGAWETALGWGWGAAFSQATPSTHRGRPEGRARGPRCSVGLFRLLYWRPEELQLGRFSSFLTCIYFYSLHVQRRQALQRETRRQSFVITSHPPCLPKVARPLEGTWNLRQIRKFKACAPCAV